MLKVTKNKIIDLFIYADAWHGLEENISIFFEWPKYAMFPVTSRPINIEKYQTELRCIHAKN